MRVERVDILDENGAYTGKTCIKSVAHQKGYFHPTVHIWIYTKNGEVLLQKRAPNKDTFPNLWDVSVAGHMEAGENIRKAALREVNEEIGLVIKESQLHEIGIRKSMQQHPNGIRDNEFHHIFLCKCELDTEELIIQKEELSAIRLENIRLVKENLIKSPSIYVPHGLDYYDFILSEIEKIIGK